MADHGEFQEQVRQLAELVTRFDLLPDGQQKTAGKELIQLLMEVHSQGLARMMDIVFESRETGGALIDRLGKDEVAGGLLLLYSLHPDALETRVNTAVERMRPRLRKLSCAVELLDCVEGAVRIKVARSGHACGSSATEARTIVENCIYELAPDVNSLEIVGLEEPVPTGFVALERLLPAGPRDMRTLQAGAAR